MSAHLHFAGAGARRPAARTAAMLRSHHAHQKSDDVTLLTTGRGIGSLLVALAAGLSPGLEKQSLVFSAQHLPHFEHRASQPIGIGIVSNRTSLACHPLAFERPLHSS